VIIASPKERGTDDAREKQQRHVLGGLLHEHGQKGQSPAFAVVVRPKQEQDVFERDDERQRPDHEGDEADDFVMADPVMRERPQGLAERVERTGSDVSVDDADRAEQQHPETFGFVMSVVAVGRGLGHCKVLGEDEGISGAQAQRRTTDDAIPSHGRAVKSRPREVTSSQLQQIRTHVVNLRRRRTMPFSCRSPPA
jgi:hypothetical protein